MRKGYEEIEEIDEEDIKEEKIKNKKKRKIIFLFITMAASVFLVFQTIQIIRYTFGDIDKKDAFLYNLLTQNK